MSGGKILVVDDNELARVALDVVLFTGGYEVEFAANGVDAIRALRREHFDAVLLDLDMPRLGGIDMLTLLRTAEFTESPPVLVVTASDQAWDIQRAKEAGAVGFFSKDGGPICLLKALSRLLDKRDIVWIDEFSTVSRPASERDAAAPASPFRVLNGGLDNESRTLTRFHAHERPDTRSECRVAP